MDDLTGIRPVGSMLMQASDHQITYSLRAIFRHLQTTPHQKVFINTKFLKSVVKFELSKCLTDTEMTVLHRYATRRQVLQRGSNLRVFTLTNTLN